MFTPIHVSTRDLLRHYKQVIDRVKATREPAVVVSQKAPQVAIVSLDDLDALTDLRNRDSARTLLETARRVRAALQDEHLPADLSTQHDRYLWGDDKESRDGRDQGRGGGHQGHADQKEADGRNEQSGDAPVQPHDI